MKLLLATNNANKVREVRQILGDGVEVVSLKDMGIVSDPEETGTTFAENARIKALAGLAASGLPCMADDSGLGVDALDGAPGVYSARYAGPACVDKENNALLLKNLDGVANRSAAFHCAISLCFPDGTELLAEGKCEGVITHEPRGDNGFGYDPLFYVESYGKTFAELSAQEKNAISHRSRALANLKEKLEEYTHAHK